MIRHIFRSIFVTALVVFLASYAIIVGVLYQYFTQVQENQLRVETHMAAQGLNLEGREYLKDLHTDNDYRITWIDAKGKVLFESSSVPAARMENHLQREEVQKALKSGFGTSRRYSDTLMERSLYAAQRLSDGSVIRLSVSQQTVPHLIFGMMHAIVLTLVFVVLLSLFLSSRLSRRIVRPLNDLDLDHPLSNEEYDELSPLLHRIDSQQKQLKDQQEVLEQKQNELNVITDSMNDGMILLNSRMHIISINHGARRILHADDDCVGKNILEAGRFLELQQAISQAAKGRRSEQRMETEDGIFDINAAPVRNSEEQGKITGIAILLVDVTQRENAEQMRREFTANVSHELKTPLTSISGYAELMENGMVREKDIRPFAGKIHAEAVRMTHLIEDIIHLSRLDEGAADGMDREKVDLQQLTVDVVEELQPAAEKMQVSVRCESEPVTVCGVRQQLKSIVFNLCENAIKYNKTGGQVMIHLYRKDDEAYLAVQDTGIGISPKDRNRIFERFYRVDKSHSREIGGTGLGLSIVKHAVMIHKGRISVESEPGKGTVFTVMLPIR